MRIIIITQNEPFYLVKSLSYLISNLPSHSQIIGCVIAPVSPFGKKESFIAKAIKTYKIFGFKFFVFYALKFIKSKLFNQSLNSLLEKNQILNIELNSNINSQDSLEKIKSYKPDLLISILANQIFKKKLIQLSTKGCINLHTALLPKYRGLMPTFWVLKNNEKYTGVSVFYVDEGIDSGPIIVQKKIEIGNRSQAQLIDHTKKVGMKCIIEAVDLIFKNKVQIIPNPDSKKTYYSFPTRDDVRVFKDLNKSFF